MSKRIREIVIYLLLIVIKIRCWVVIYLYGSETLSQVFSKLPQVHIVPILRYFGASIGENTRINPGIILHNLNSKKRDEVLKNLTIGKNCYIGREVLFDLKTSITIGKDSALGARCQVWTHVGDYSHDFSDYHEKTGLVQIGNGVLCWSGIIICPGVKIGDYTRVAAGSVVVKNLESQIFAGGVPAKFIKKRDI